MWLESGLIRVLGSRSPRWRPQRRKPGGRALPAILVGARKEVTMCSLPGLATALILAAFVTASPAQELRIGTSFVGSTFGVDSGVFPPDTNGAVGKRHIVELLNGHYAAYRKNDGSRVASSSLEQFWIDGGVTPRGFVVDSRVLFDPAANRWYASSLSINFGNGPDDLLFAVSRDDDPTQGWSAFSVPFAGPVGTFGDFPTLGFNSDGIFVFTNGSVLVVPKADVLASQPTLARASLVQSRDLLTPAGGKVQPAVNLDNSAAALLLGHVGRRGLGHADLAPVGRIGHARARAGRSLREPRVVSPAGTGRSAPTRVGHRDLSEFAVPRHQRRAAQRPALGRADGREPGARRAALVRHRPGDQHTAAGRPDLGRDP
jgi:hypothetical protein